MNSGRDELIALNDDKTLAPKDYSAKVAALKQKDWSALPFLEKSVELDPKTLDALRNLKNYYDFMQDEAKAAEVQAKIDASN